MPQVELTSQLAQLAECPAIQTVEADTLSKALEQLFAQYGQLRDHVLNANGAVHAHLALFVDGQMIDRDRLEISIKDNSEIFLMQALSGG